MYNYIIIINILSTQDVLLHTILDKLDSNVKLDSFYSYYTKTISFSDKVGDVVHKMLLSNQDKFDYNSERHCLNVHLILESDFNKTHTKMKVMY